MKKTYRIVLSLSVTFVVLTFGAHIIQKRSYEKGCKREADKVVSVVAQTDDGRDLLIQILYEGCRAAAARLRLIDLF